MSIRSWLRAKWDELVPGSAYILGMYGTIINTLPVARGTAYRYQLNSKAPNSQENWIARWRWVTDPLPGVTLDHPDSTYTVVNIAASAPAGMGRIEVVYTRYPDGHEVRSKPMLIYIFQPAVETLAGV